MWQFADRFLTGWKKKTCHSSHERGMKELREKSSLRLIVWRSTRASAWYVVQTSVELSPITVELLFIVESGEKVD
jgi:hypothetical protein